MKQVIAIHGGDAHSNRAEFLKALRTDPVERDDFKSMPTKRWRHRLQEQLGSAYEVFVPEMPCAESAKYAEWKIWFERLLKFVDKGTIFVGHSLGGIFLAKYF